MRTLTASIFLLAFSLCISSWMCSPKKKKAKPKFHVTGTILETRSYCGGAAPTQEILDRCNTPLPVPMGKLFVKKGGENKDKSQVIDTLVADADGKFSADLPAGTYCLVEEWKAGKMVLPENTEMQTVDSTCYRNRYNSCDYQLVITDKNVEGIKITFHRSCAWNQPCISYHGPLPPMAQPHHGEGKVGE